MTDERKNEEEEEVFNLDDLIEARSERDSSISADIDGMPDADVSDMDVDVDKELSQPHRHGPTEDQILGIDVKLMDTPDERDIAFDRQDSEEEMLPTDPDPQDGMGNDEAVEEPGELDLVEIVGPFPPEEEQAE